MRNLLEVSPNQLPAKAVEMISIKPSQGYKMIDLVWPRNVTDRKPSKHLNDSIKNW